MTRSNLLELQTFFIMGVEIKIRTGLPLYK